MKLLLLTILFLSGCSKTPQMKCELVHNADLKIECSKRNSCATSARQSGRDPATCFPEPWKSWMIKGSTG